jgi:hypothetical protein
MQSPIFISVALEGAKKHAFSLSLGPMVLNAKGSEI